MYGWIHTQQIADSDLDFSDDRNLFAFNFFAGLPLPVPDDMNLEVAKGKKM